jgi:hypothetical protein
MSNVSHHCSRNEESLAFPGRVRTERFVLCRRRLTVGAQRARLGAMPTSARAVRPAAASATWRGAKRSPRGTERFGSRSKAKSFGVLASSVAWARASTSSPPLRRLCRSSSSRGRSFILLGQLSSLRSAASGGRSTSAVWYPWFRSEAPKHMPFPGPSGRHRSRLRPPVANPSIERTASGLRPPAAAHVQR